MNEYIRRAEHALRTGQPNLAVLYMRRGLAETPEGQIWLIWHDFKRSVDTAANLVRGAFRL
jgi:hypothetical protein